MTTSAIKSNLGIIVAVGSAVHTPIGLPIGSKTVQEIAIRIAAQLVEIRSKKKESHGE